MLRTLALVAAAGLLLGGAAPAPAASGSSDHDTAAAALADVRAAITTIVSAENSTATSPVPYHRAARRAIAIVDGGAVARVNHLLDRRATEPWTATLEGANANLLGAVASLRQALRERQMEDYQLDVTTALADLEMALGRTSQTGVLGGLRGAFSTTTLGVPDGGRVVSACGPPSAVPAYGTIDGRLAYLALPLGPARVTVGPDFGVQQLAVVGHRLMLYTAAADESAALCRKVAAASDPPPAAAALYTLAQAKAGEAIFADKCVACHGVNLQGTAAPAVAGTAFLSGAKQNTWSLSDLRAIVVDNMPFSDPGSLTPKQYAEVMAFLLASNCYPAGTTPFPEHGQASFAAIAIAPPPGAHPDNAALGTCTVR